MKKIVAVLLTLLMLHCLAPAEEPRVLNDGLWEYTLTDEGAVLTNWKWYTDGHAVPEVVKLPSELDGHPLVGIGYNALNTSEMDSEIGFTLVVPEGVTFLEEVAFQCCHNADAIHLPASLTEIPEGCFHHVGAEITVADGNPRYVMQDGFLIDTLTGTLLYAAPSATGKALPAVRRLGTSSLDNWREWEMAAVIPEGVEEMGAFLFQDMAMTSLVLPSTLRLIEQDAIDGEIAQPVEIPASVEMIQRGNFTRAENAALILLGATHFETADEYEARTGYRHWLDDWADE